MIQFHTDDFNCGYLFFVHWQQLLYFKGTQQRRSEAYGPNHNLEKVLLFIALMILGGALKDLNS